MSNRAKKTQKRTAKKKAAIKKQNKAIESDRQELIRQLSHMSQVKKKHLYFMMVEEGGMCREDVDLLFDVMKKHLGADFDDLKAKPSALAMHEYEIGFEGDYAHWFDAFATEMTEKYEEHDVEELIRNIAALYTALLITAKTTIDRYNEGKVELAV